MSDAISAPKRSPYEVLGVPTDASDDQIKSAYKKLALKYHPDKNANNEDAAELFKEVAYSYSILSDPEKRKLYDTVGFAGVSNDGFDMELDLSNLGTVNTMFAALFSKLGVPIKTTISTSVLEEAINGTVTIRPLPLGRTVHDRVEKQGAHFFGITISDTQAQAGIVVRVTSAAQSKFKLLYFEQEEMGRLELSLQEDSVKTGNVTSAGMYFLHYQVYRLDTTLNTIATAKDPDAAFFKKFDGLQPCEVSSLKEGTHIFAVYGDNFFKSASYAIEAVCASEEFQESKEKLKEVEAEMLRKRNMLHEFEKEYKEVLARFTAVTNRYAKEKQEIEELLKQREMVQASFASTVLKRTMSSTNMKLNDDMNEESPLHQEAAYSDKERSQKKKWFSFKTEKKP